MFSILDLLGLGQIKLSVTTVICIAIALALAGLAGFGLYEAHEIKTLEQAAGQAKQQITTLTAANQDLNKQLSLIAQSSQIDNQVSTTDMTQKEAAQTATSGIAATAQNQITRIVKQYQPLGPAQVVPSADAAAESKAISTVRINSMWQTYCTAVPASTEGCGQAPTHEGSPEPASALAAGVNPAATP